MLERVRELRKSSTDAERVLWRILRGRQLAGFKFRRQHELAGFILDFYCHSARMAVEIDGGQHYSEAGVSYDERRTQILAAKDVRVLRFTNTDVLTQSVAVCDAILRALLEATPSP